MQRDQLLVSTGISKMPRDAKDHNANKQRICAVCFLKQKSIRKISDDDLTNIRDTVFDKYHKDNSENSDGENWSWLPDVICLGCHKAVFNAAANPSGGLTVNHIDYCDLKPPPMFRANVTRSADPEATGLICDCSMCWVGRMGAVEYSAFEKRMKEPVGRPRIHPEPEKPEPVMICSKCGAEYGRGKTHDRCNESGRKANIVANINKGDQRSREQLLADQLRAVVAEKGAGSGDVVTIAGGSTGGRGGKLEVAIAPAHLHLLLKSPPVRFTHEALMRIQLKMGASDRGMRHLSRFIRYAG